MTRDPIDEFLAGAAQDTYYYEEDYLPEEEVYYYEPVYEPDELVFVQHVYHTAHSVNLLIVLVPVCVTLLFLIGIFLRQGGFNVVEAAPAETAVGETAVPVKESMEDDTIGEGETAVSTPDLPSSKNDIIAPYDDFVLTQGIHGASYGHMAIDIAAGNGAIIYSPIDGTVTSNYVDEYLNTVLIIENDKYEILMLHGDYLVVVGDEVKQGQPVGNESNHGYTKDMYGNLCYQRDCGYHTHLNIYDKTLGKNVNPLDVLDLN